MATLEWVRIPRISLATAARNAGYDITIYYEYPPDVRDIVRKVVIKDTLAQLAQTYRERTRKFLAGKSR